MSDSQEETWSDNPNAPSIPALLYHAEKTWFAGQLVASMLYGMLIVLFFKCMIALFNPANRRGEGIKWQLVSYTVIMFSLATVYIAMTDHILSISYIDNRNYPVGPFIYRLSLSFKAINAIPIVAFRLNSWLADGLLLYRCYIFHTRSLWIIAFPFLMYLGSVATGILTIPYAREWGMTRVWTNPAHLSISLSLNLLLTLMIVVRLSLHVKNVRAAMGFSAGVTGLYKSIATMLIESSALFAVSSLLAVATWIANIPVENTFMPILAEVQVIASLLIILRVANKSALSGNATTPGSTTPPRAGSQGGAAGISVALPGEYPMKFAGERGTSSGEFGVGVETVIDLRREKV